MNTADLPHDRTPDLPDDLRDALTAVMKPYFDAGWQIHTGRPIGRADRIAIHATSPDGASYRENFDQNDGLPSAISAFLSHCGKLPPNVT